MMTTQQNNDGCGDAQRCVIFLDFDGVLNTTKHNTQIHFEPHLVKHLKSILEASDALIVLSTFWRHFHDYIKYVLHRNGINVDRNMLPLPMGATKGKQCTKKFLHYHRLRQKESGLDNTEEEMGNDVTIADDDTNCMIGRSADDEAEYASRAEEIEAWLKQYGEKYLGQRTHKTSECMNTKEKEEEYAFHCTEWRYVILDDRPSAATPNTPLYDRFVHTETKLGLTDANIEKAITLLQFGSSTE